MKKISIIITVFSIFLLTSNNIFAQCCTYTAHQQVEPATSAATFGVALGDFDSDGDNDAVSISAYYGIDIYYNDGSGTFALDSQYAIGANTDFYGVYVIDIDGDIDLDIIAMPFYTSANLTILKNNGSGVFTVSTASSNTATYYGAIGDIDGDNDIDVFLPHATGTTGQIFKNNGSGVFSLYQSPSGAKAHDAELGDLDGDGDLDAFLVSNSTYGNSVFLNDSNGNFTQLGGTFGTNGSNVDLGDLDGDGDLDAWVGRSNNQSEIYLNDGNASFTLYNTITTGSYCKSVNMYDYDGDGDLDIFMGFYSSAPQVWTNDSLSFTLCFQASVGSGSHGQAIGFINNDNNIDIYSGLFSNTNGDYVFINSSSSIEYTNSPFCPYISSPQSVLLSGTSGGTYSASPNGLYIDSLSGDIIPDSSTSGTYTVYYIEGSCTTNTIIVIKSLDISTFTTGNMITANQDSATYQWVDCNHSYLAITGEIGQSYTPTSSGDYAVIITYNGCTDTSACVNIITTEIYETTQDDLLLIYPNPANASINVKISSELIGTSFIIYDQIGKAVMSGKLDEENSIINLEHLSTGLYILKADKNVHEIFTIEK